MRRPRKKVWTPPPRSPNDVGAKLFRNIGIVSQTMTDAERYEMPACNLCGCDMATVVIYNAKATGFALVECVHCGLRFFAPRPKWKVLAEAMRSTNDAQVEAEHYYAWGSFVPVPDPAVQKRNIDSYYRKMLDDARAVYGGEFKSMFEIAGSAGWFGVAAKATGLEVIEGVELNTFAAAICRERQGLPGIEAGDFLEYQPRRTYDLVVALDYLEHTYFPRQNLQKMADMTNPGGVVMLKTFLDELDVNHEQLAPPVHCIHWTEPTLRRAIEAAGLEIGHWLIGYGDYQIEIVAKKP